MNLFGLVNPLSIYSTEPSSTTLIVHTLVDKYSNRTVNSMFGLASVRITEVRISEDPLYLLSLVCLCTVFLICAAGFAGLTSLKWVCLAGNSIQVGVTVVVTKLPPLP